MTTTRGPLFFPLIGRSTLWPWLRTHHFGGARVAAGDVLRGPRLSCAVVDEPFPDGCAS